MSSRFPSSNLHQRDPRSALFENYNGGGHNANTNGNQPHNQNQTHPSSSSSTNRTASPYSGGYGYGVGSDLGNGNGGYGGSGSGSGRGDAGFRTATPNSRGQYSDAVLNELESQNDGQVEGILGKVRMLKDMTIAIGDEIRDSSALAEKMNDSFDGTRVRLRGTMNRMLIMADRTGVGWKVWLGFFAAVGFLFFYVWVF